MTTPITERVEVKTAGQGMTFDSVSMHFPDGTHAVDNVSFSIGPANSSRSSGRPAAANRRC